MISRDQATSLVGATAHSTDGHKVGRIGFVFFDDKSGEPAWATVSTGLFGRRESFVPLEGAQFDGADVHLGVDRDTIRRAPNVDPHAEHLSEDDERALYSFYNRDYGPEAYASGTTADEGYSGPGSPRFEPATPAQHAAFLRAGATMAGGNVPPRAADEAASGVTPAAAPTPAAPVRVDADMVERLEQEATAGEQRFRVRLRRYLQDPAIAERPVAEQAEIEDEAVSGQAVEGAPTTPEGRPH